MRHIRTIILTALALALLPGHRVRADDEHPVPVKIWVDSKVMLGHVSPDFLGFGYESSAVAQPNYFTAKNATLVQLYRNLSTHGLVRIGGNVSDHTKYLPEGPAAAQSEKKVTAIDHACLVEFGQFLQATGWKAMWGLNLGTGTKQEAADEAAAVDAALKDHLQSFEVGNEVDLHRGFGTGLKGYDGYHAAYLDYKAAVRAAVPQARFSGPDSAGSFAFVRNFASTEAGDMKLLTMHYYRTGATSANATIENLLARDDGWEHQLAQLQKLSGESKVPFRINEVNSFYGGGKPGVSDTFASALWCVDYMFLLASHNCGGVNMETDINQHAFISHYSPIVHDPSGHCSARPEYYGMLAFAMAGKGDLLKTTVEKGAVNMTAYAARDDQGSIWLTVINKDMSRDAKIEASVPDGYATAGAFRLTAPSVESKDQVTFAGSEVSENGQWSPGAPESLTVTDGHAAVDLPHASAVVLRLGANEPRR